MKRLITAIATLSLLAGAGAASAADKMIIGIGVMHGTADLAVQSGNVNTAFASPELGGRFEYWNMMRENYALNFQANIGFQSESDKPRTGAPANTPEAKFTTTSWSVRLGGDRVWSPLANTQVFVGPGLEFWMGKAKFEGGAGGFSATTAYETEQVKRISLHGHTGAIMMLGPSWGISGQLGHKLGYASYEEKGGKTTWWPNSIDGAMELVFGFGGK